MLRKSVLLAAVASAAAFTASPVSFAGRGLPAVSTSRPLSLRGGAAVKMVLCCTLPALAHVPIALGCQELHREGFPSHSSVSPNVCDDHVASMCHNQRHMQRQSSFWSLIYTTLTPSSLTIGQVDITPNVSFDTIAREVLSIRPGSERQGRSALGAEGSYRDCLFFCLSSPMCTRADGEH
jgi:hypothetical protein